MKKTALAFFFCCFFIVFNGKAQLRTAIAGGAQIASVPGNSSPQWDTLNHKYSSRTGFHIGLLAEVPFFNSSNVYFRTGMLYTNKGRNFSSSYDTASSAVSSVTGRQFVNYMEIPVNVVFKLNLSRKTRFVFGGGPYVSFLFSGRETINTNYKNGTVNNIENTSLKIPHSQGRYKNMDLGVNAFAGMEFGRLFINANYSRGLDNFYQTHNNVGSFRHQVMGATVGLFLSSDKKSRDAKQNSKQTKQRDRDNDGVPDVNDKCPKQKGSALANGCPDKDGDGVADLDDACPNIAGTAKRSGCPAPDSDKDGVNDDDDKCPDETGSMTNSGCPEIDEALKTEIAGFAKRVQFKYRSTSLSNKSKLVLDEVVKILKKNPKLNVLIEGYTSSDGNGRNHLSLSQGRANSVKEYLELNGIRVKRLKAVGFGDSNPINKNKTEAERALNRRVELKITNF